MEVLELHGTIHRLPDELLLEIFQNIGSEELVTSIQHVCIRWKNVVHTYKLWKNIAYKPPSDYTDDEVINMLKLMTQLRIFVFNPHIQKVDEVIEVLCSHCPFLKTLICDNVYIKKKSLLKMYYCLNYLENIQLSEWQMVDGRSLFILGQFKSLKRLTNVNIGPTSTYRGHDENVFQSLESIEMIAYCTGDIIIPPDQRDSWARSHFLHSVPDLKNLTRLSVDFRMLHFSGFESVFCNLRKLCNLEILSLNSLFHADKDILTKTFSSCTFPKLRKLDVSNSLNVNLETVRAICQSCPIIHEAHFGRCVNFDDDCAKALINCQELMFLDLSCCNHVTETGLAFLARCRKLSILDLSWRDIIPNHTLPVISTLPHLKALILDHTDLKQEDIIELVSNSKYIEYLALHGCNGIDGTFIENLIPKCKIKHSSVRILTWPDVIEPKDQP